MIFSHPRNLLPLLCALVYCVNAGAQTKQPPKKYPSLLWEITGNGLKKPSYLFGTMHVSSKKAFHLSDSFFIAIRRADVVALELNPDIWQQEMVVLDREKSNYNRFYTDRSGRGSNIRDISFRIDGDFLPGIKTALQESPMIINSLLYRSRDYAEDFEENTFLDMYIYQTGKKLGKRASGVENLFEMERLTTEAEIDRGKEKNRKKKYNDYDDDRPEMTMDEAYRRGDLDMLDSLDRLMNESDAYIEKFLYKRNEVQARSMDTIMKKGVVLFCGVGAAHLPGTRGVIEELRKMGYTLRPIKMIDRDAKQRDQIDHIRVPVVFTDYTSEDGFFKLKAPGKLYRRDDTETGNGWQYADMSNGAYYMVTRVPTLSGYLGMSEEAVFRKIDSVLYENVPGKILKKTTITRNGYKGLDVVNKTRRGDVQRYHIFVTPFETLIFKMSGIENYVQEGREANDFFNSITLTAYKNGQWTAYQPATGGFTVQTPHKPFVMDELGGDWTWAAADHQGLQYLMLKRVFQNDYLNAHDTLMLALMEESFVGAEKKLNTISRRFNMDNGQPALNGLYSRNDSFLAVKYLANGPMYYLLAAKGANRARVEANTFIQSFKTIPFKYAANRLFTDTFVKFSVQTPMVPEVRDSLKILLQDYETYGGRYNYYSNKDEQYSHYDRSKSMTFANDTTGESITVSMNKRGKYYFLPDSARIYYRIADSLAAATPNKKELFRKTDSLWNRYNAGRGGEYRSMFDSMYIFLRREVWKEDGAWYSRTDYTDTGTSRLVKYLNIVKDNTGWTVSAITSLADSASGFTETFIRSFKPLLPQNTIPVYISRTDSFFSDYYSTDTTTRKLARSAIDDVDFGKKDIPRMVEAMNRLNIKDKDYFETRVKWIDALGDIRDSTAKPLVIEELKKVYQRSADTSLFQNAVLKSLSGMRTKEALAVFKEYLLQDPPVETSEYSYSDDNFMEYEDSLELVKTLFPEILQLTALDDYKSIVNNMLVRLIDSNRITARDYEPYFSKILFDARIALKKQQKKDEQQVQEELSKDDDDKRERYSSTGGSDSQLENYVTLLLPFYDQNPAVPRYFEKLLQTRNNDLKFEVMMQLLEKKKRVPDTLVGFFAGLEEKRGLLYYRLHKIKQLHHFPQQYKKQDEMAKAFIYQQSFADDEDNDEDGGYGGYYSPGEESLSYYRFRRFRDNYSSSQAGKKFDSIVLLRKQWVEVDKKKGWLYIYQYRRDKEDKWRFALSGLQPEKADSIATANRFTKLTETKLKDVEEESLDDQLKLLVKKAIFAGRRATREFFTEDDDRRRYRGLRYHID